ncbi:MAG TPA: hypothetical protein VMG98_16420 [Verrucomicrobiae bacterium]|nr:hypothetical protein [Verrucomicrobiae bacterium]
MRTSIVGTAFVLACLAVAAGCGGGGSSPSTSSTATPTSSPTTVPTGPPSTAAPISTATASSASVANGGYAVYVNFPASTSGTATMAMSGSTTVGSNPAGITPFTTSGSYTTLIYVTFQPSATVTLPSYPQFQLQIPAAQAPQGYNFWGAIYTNDSTFPAGHDAWSPQFLGPASASGQTLYFPAPTTPLTFTGSDYYVFALYEVPT